MKQFIKNSLFSTGLVVCLSAVFSTAAIAASCSSGTKCKDIKLICASNIDDNNSDYECKFKVPIGNGDHTDKYVKAGDSSKTTGYEDDVVKAYLYDGSNNVGDEQECGEISEDSTHKLEYDSSGNLHCGH